MDSLDSRGEVRLYLQPIICFADFGAVRDGERGLKELVSFSKTTNGQDDINSSFEASTFTYQRGM